MSTFKQFLNTLYCPICKSQIDKDNNRSFYHCAYNKDHYICALNDCKILQETIHIYDFNKFIMYEITQNYLNGISTHICIEKIDGEGRVIFDFEAQSYKTNIVLFDFKNFNIDKAINKIKTFLIFR